MRNNKRIDPFLSLKVDDGTTVISIPTPKNWKCKRKGCQSKVKHIHAKIDITKMVGIIGT